jgi:2-polyprenyl-6-methoxyphenol hydroxylase-like FAD-dependent oxidoreductase
LEADLVVGADGIRSEVRRRLFGDIRPMYMGYRSHRFVVDNAAGIESLHRSARARPAHRPGADLEIAAVCPWTTFKLAP